MSSRKLFVWDFHGVLEQGTHRLAQAISNVVLAREGFAERLSDEQALALFGRRWWEYFEHLLPAAGRDTWLRLQAACLGESARGATLLRDHVEAAPHARQVLETIAAVHPQILVSNSDPEGLDAFLAAVDLGDLFPTGRRFATNAHGAPATRTKLAIVREYLERHPHDRVVVVGDSPGDMRLKGAGPGIVTYWYRSRADWPPGVVADHRISDLREVLCEVDR